MKYYTLPQRASSKGRMEEEEKSDEKAGQWGEQNERKLRERKRSRQRGANELEADDSGFESEDDDQLNDDQLNDGKFSEEEETTWEEVLAEWKRRDSYPSRRATLRDRVFVDWRRSGCLSVARCQGSECGSCGVFSTIGLYEWAFCMGHKERRRLDFSEQYVLDCGGFHVCERGVFEENVAQFVQESGLELANTYPYKEIERHCPYPKGYPSDRRGLIRLDRPQLRQIAVYDWERQLRISPILATFYLAPNFDEYQGGLDMGLQCDKTEAAHSMLVVGSGRQQGVEYWLLRNSYGDWWGEQGYYRLNKLSDCYHYDGFGLVMEALWFGREPEEGEKGRKKSASNQIPAYKFSKNSKYHWKVLAEALGFSEEPEIPADL